MGFTDDRSIQPQSVLNLNQKCVSFPTNLSSCRVKSVDLFKDFRDVGVKCHFEGSTSSLHNPNTVITRVAFVNRAGAPVARQRGLELRKSVATTFEEELERGESWPVRRQALNQSD